MKKWNLLFAGILFLLLSLHVKAQSQSNSDYFAGKWSVLVEGTPNGDAKMTVKLEKKDGKLTGSILDSTGKETSKIDKIEEKDKTITAYFNTQGYDVYLLMEPVDADRIKGSMMGMFDVKGDRVKETK